MTKGPLALLFVLSTLISISYIQGCCIQTSYAVQQEEGVRTLGIKVYLLKSTVEQGTIQTINFQVADQKSHQPIGGAITSATVNYADGKTVRQFNTPTDISGRSSISWRIERNAPAGHYNVVYSVSETGYVPAPSFVSPFSVVAHSVNEFNHYHNSPSSLLSGLPFLPYSWADILKNSKKVNVLAFLDSATWIIIILGRWSSNTSNTNNSANNPHFDPSTIWLATSDHMDVPQVIFTDPQIASVGLTEESARSFKINVRAVDSDIGTLPGKLAS